MKVLVVEDNAFKHMNISIVLEECGIYNSMWVECLTDGLNTIQKALEGNVPYDLIITDMWYPVEKGGREVESGKALITRLQEMGLETPIIVCSSARYNIPEIYGCVHYSSRSYWESDLKELIEELKRA